jgi:hypothetical protein
MRRFMIVAATALALSVPTSVAVVATSTPAFAASTVRCTQLSGTLSGNVTLSGCTPHSKSSRSVTGAASSLLYGGTVTWRPSGRQTTVRLIVKSPGQGSCRKGSTEEDATGSVTGGSSTYARKGSPVSIRACFARQGGTLSLVRKSAAVL